MTTQTHTPGPWAQEGEDPLIVSGCSGLLSVAEVHDHSDTSENHNTAEALANARLIAAAPDLLAVLEAVYGMYHGDLGEHYDGTPKERLRAVQAIINNAGAAIAKAKSQ